MSIEENKATLLRWLDPPEGWESLNQRVHGAEDSEAKLDEFYKNAREEFFNPDFVRHHPRGDMNLDAYIQHDRTLWTAIPDLNISIKEIIGEGDWVMARMTMQGTHKGTFLGIPATGEKIETGGMIACRFVGGKFAEYWAYHDELTLMQQLGVIPKQ